MSEEVKKGLLGIVVDETEVSKVMPEINSLTYRGYAVQDLCEFCRFEEAAYLILKGDLPNSIELRQFEKIERGHRDLSKNLYEIIKHMPKKSHPMDVARTAVSVMGLEDKETTDNSQEANTRKALRILAKTPTALAAFYRIRKGKKIIKPKKELTFAENFFYMCFGKVPQKEIVKAFDVSLILYAEHSFNVSTFTARTITSSLSDIHGAITGAIASLKGPLHGGANEEVMHMMNKIKKPENALAISGGKVEAFVSVQSEFNLELEKERVNATLKKLESENIKLSEKLNNKNFRDKAPKTVIEKFESDHEDLKSKLNKQKSLLEGLEKINNWS